MSYIIKIPRMSPTCLSKLCGYPKALAKENVVKVNKMCFLHSTFLNRDFSLDIVRKCIKFCTVLLRSVLEGSVSHSFDVGF